MKSPKNLKRRSRLASLELRVLNLENQVDNLTRLQAEKLADEFTGSVENQTTT